MGTEIERKFLVRNDSWRESASPGARLRQGYLCREPGRSVRVRVLENAAFLTIKGRTSGISRTEFEYQIPRAEGEALLEICEGSLLSKTRYIVVHDAKRWEVDEFHGENEGLVLAEIELDDEQSEVALPPWAGEEVSGDPRYYNLYLAEHPYRTWNQSLTESAPFPGDD